MSTSRYSLNSFGESSSASTVSLSSDEYGDRNIFSPGPSSPAYNSTGNNIMHLDESQQSPMSISPSLSPLPPRHKYTLASHITMTDNIGPDKNINMGTGGSRNRTMSESAGNYNRQKQRDSVSSAASSTDSAKARVSSRNARNLRRAKSFKNNSRDGSSLSRRQSTSSTSSLNKKPPTDSKKVPYTKNEITFNVRKAQFGRRGWMVMPTEETIDLKQFKPEVLDTVTSKIRTMELSGITVPDQIKIRLSEC